MPGKWSEVRKEEAGEYGMLISAHQLIDHLRPPRDAGCQPIVISRPDRTRGPHSAPALLAVNPQIQPIFVTNSYFQNRYLGPRLGPWLKIPIAATFFLARWN